MKRGETRGIDARTCKQANLRVFQDSINKFFKDAKNRDINTLFYVDFKGHRFNCLPFILSGSSYFDGNCYGWILKLIAKELPAISDVSIDEIYKSQIVNAKLFDALMPGDIGRREMYALALIKCEQSALKMLVQCATTTLNRVLFGEGFHHLRFADKTLCNTQALCYYMPIYWLCNITPQMRAQIEPTLRRAKFIEEFEALIPEESIHFKYIAGELTTDQLIKAYTDKTFEDGSSVVMREAYSLASRGKWPGGTLNEEQLAIAFEDVTDSFHNVEMYMNMHLAHAYLFGGTYKDMSDKLDSLESTIRVKDGVEAKVRQKYSRATDEIKQLKEANKSLQSRVTQLQVEISRQNTDADLRKRIAELEQKLAASNDENDRLFAERLELKQELSVRAKQIKKLNARLDSEVAEEITIGVVTEEIPIETMVEAIKDKRIILIGGDRSKTLVKTLNDLGLRYVTNMSGNVRKAECDFCVVLTILCSHSDVFQAERYVKGTDTEVVYVNGVNAELVLRQVYDAHISSQE